MQSDSKLAVGQRVELRFGATWLPTRVEDCSAEQLVLAWPTDATRRLVPLKVGDTVVLAATADDALYSAPARVHEAKTEGLPLLTLRVQDEWQRSQRRNAVRVPVAIRPRLAVRVSDDKRQPLRAGITNLSAMGCQLRSQDELKPGDVLELAFSVMDVNEEIVTQAVVRRVQQHERGTLHVWDAGCEFPELPQRVGQKLVQFIFAQQRAMARSRKVG